MLPDSIPESLWAEFRKMRKKIKAPMTEHAEGLILAKLEKWRIESGANPVDILNESIEKSWRGVFLNGHGMGKPANGGASSSGLDTAPPTPVCCSCGKPLTSGFVHTSRGRRCHEC